MRVFVSQDFENYSSPEARVAIVSAFKWWKAEDKREFASPFFGKDSALIKPKVGGREYCLRHCHLAPLNDEAAKQKWARAHRHGSRKTSDRVLIYVQSGNDFFIIDIVDDPGAHEAMRMTDKQGRSFMHTCALQADAFLRGELKPAVA